MSIGSKLLPLRRVLDSRAGTIRPTRSVADQRQSNRFPNAAESLSFNRRLSLDTSAPDEAATLPPMQRSKNIILVGPMGAGKSTVGKRLARMLGRRFVDLDELIEERTGVSIPLIFEVEGEQNFRRRESQALQEVIEWPDLVLATGGGSVLLPENRECLRSHGFVVYLRASVSVQLQRLARDRKRPLLQAPDRRQRLEQMAEQRNPLYLAVADEVAESVSDRPAKLARQLATRLSELGIAEPLQPTPSESENCH